MTDQPDHAKPPPPAVQIPGAATLAMLPEWARPIAVLVPLLGAGGLGGAGGFFGATQATADQAVLAAKVERVQADVQALDAKIDRLMELVLRGDR